MRKVIFYTSAMLFLSSCGGEEEAEGEKAPAAVEPKVIHTTDTIVNNDIDSALLGKMAEIADKRTDSLYLELDSLSNSNDSLLAMINFMKTSIDKNLPVQFPKPDTTDYNKPPTGSAKNDAYMTFESVIPAKGKELKALPKELIGTYSKPDNAQIEISKNDIWYTDTKGKRMKIFNIGSDQICSQGSNCYLLQYKTGKEWRVVTLTLKNGNLSFRIIPKEADLKKEPTKKELNKYLEKNSGDLLQVYAKVK
ncbi:MAG: hypothetical protein Crog4KO_23660 [Crocinitomicaceae bacterium]